MSVIGTNEIIIPRAECALSHENVLFRCLNLLRHLFAITTRPKIYNVISYSYKNESAKVIKIDDFCSPSCLLSCFLCKGQIKTDFFSVCLDYEWAWIYKTL